MHDDAATPQLISKLSYRDALRRRRRQAVRETYRNGSSIERRAVHLAERGYSVGDIQRITRLPVTQVRLIVHGTTKDIT